MKTIISDLGVVSYVEGSGLEINTNLIVNGSTTFNGSSSSLGFATLDSSGRLPAPQLPTLTFSSINDLISSSNPGGACQAYVPSIFGSYFFDPNSGLAADGRYIIQPANGSGRWIRYKRVHPAVLATSSFYIDPVAGNDDNTAEYGKPLKTVKELSYRLAGELWQNTTVNVANNVPTSDAFSQLMFTGIRDGVNNASAPKLTIVGATNVIRSGTVTSASLPTLNLNSASMIQDTSVSDWTPDIGRMVIISSGTTSGSFAWILRDVGSNSARLSRWTTTGQAVSAAPAPGDTYEVCTLTQCPSDMPDLYSGYRIGTAGQIVIQNFDIQGTIQQVRNLGQLLLIRGSKTAAIVGNESRLQLAGSLTVGNLLLGNSDSSVRLDYAAILSGAITMTLGSSFFATEPVFQTTTLSVASNATFVATSNCAFFDTANALAITQGAYAEIGTGFYGSGNTGTTTSVLRGGRLRLIVGIVPTITNSSGTELLVEGATTNIPPLVGGTTIPTASNLTTWTQWSSAPFNKAVFRYNTGTTVFGS